MNPLQAAGAGVPSFVVISQFSIANGLGDAMQSAFCQRPQRVAEPSCQSWHCSHAYHASHTGLPKGLKRVRGSTGMESFHVFANQEEGHQCWTPGSKHAMLPVCGNFWPCRRMPSRR